MVGRDWVFVTLGFCFLLCIANWDTHSRRAGGALNIALVTPLYRWVYAFSWLCVGYLGVGHLGVGYLGVWVLGVGCWVLGVG